MVDVAGVTVTAPIWGWNSYVSSGWTYDPGVVMPHSVEYAYLYASQNIHSASNTEPHITKWPGVFYNTLIDLKYLALQSIDQGLGNAVVFTLPGGGGLTANQLNTALDRIQVYIANDPVPGNASTQASSLDPSSAQFAISIDADALGAYETVFSSQAEGLNYVALHEIAHAMGKSLEFSISQGYPSTSDPVAVDRIEQYANSLAFEMASKTGVPFPDATEIQSVKGLLPSNFVNSSTGTSGVDLFYGTVYADTLHGLDGADAMSAGIGDDFVYGDGGNDQIQGNSGRDFLQGNAGADLLYGGKDADTILGGQGDDVIWGNLGNDAIYGGLGADTIHAEAGGGLDYIYDFNRSEGDSIAATGGAYTVYQSGANTVVDFGMGNMAVLLNVNLSALSSGWIHA